MENYLALAKDVLENGQLMHNRTGVDTLSVFGRTMRWRLLDGFPAVTTKKAFFKGSKVEYCWILKGLTNVSYLQKHGVNFWNQWAIKGYQRELLPFEKVADIAKKLDVSFTEDDYNDEFVMQHFGLEAFKTTDDRYAVVPATYEYAQRAIQDVFGLSAEKAEESMMKSWRTANPDLPPYKATSQSIAKAALEATGFAAEVNTKTCEVGDLGPVYGQMVRAFPNSDGTATDQLIELINGLIKNPNSRRHLVDLWCPEMLPDESMSPQANVAHGRQALAPCHMLWTFKVSEPTMEDKKDYVRLNFDKLRSIHIQSIIDMETQVRGGSLDRDTEVIVIANALRMQKLNLHYNMRSSDHPVGSPCNIMFYAIMCEHFSRDLGFIPGDLFFSGTDVHIYENQIEGLKEQLKREPLKLPRLVIKGDHHNVWDYEPEDFELIGYESHGPIKFDVAV